MKRQRWFWGVLFLLCGLLLIASRVGWLGGSFGFWSILFTIFFIASFVEGIVHFNIPVIVFSVAFLMIVYAKQLGITFLVPWTVLGAAVFIAIGLSIIFQSGWKHYRSKVTRFENSKSENLSYVKIEAKMASNIRYVRSENFKRAEINASMSNLKVYFDDTVLKEQNAVIDVQGSLSNIELFLPKTWNVIIQVEPILSGVEEKGKTTVVQEGDSPCVYLKGTLSLSGLEVNYVF
ncbi:LiaF transmembrane domain-containing protein [Liquorilactobacillus oeni]|uniref:LiaF transmembrane domain-containing protein n=1 Tax=Liquorilactobacillus oeni DSM 19972 TaxID=1423777 RepID=A0A0R1MDM6_9LACO|nr:hypothetical protein [Liquorilactobacillus oeni]KRL06001.1 hypothetical protein FD46_GL000333 [Liquorilactobacillus oeni DSM 19972]